MSFGGSPQAEITIVDGVEEAVFYFPPNIGDLNTRSVSEIILKSVAILTTATIAAGHLASLQQLSRQGSIYAVLSFIAIPTYPLASLVCNFWHGLRNAWKNGGDLHFILSAGLGMQALEIGAGPEDAMDAVALVNIPLQDLQCVGKKYDLKWCSRLAVLALFEVQAITTMVIVARRISHLNMTYFGIVNSRRQAAGFFDVVNGLFAMGGSIAGFTSIAITLLNCSWERINYSSRRERGMDTKRRMSIETGMLIQLVLVILLVSFNEGIQFGFSDYFDSFHEISSTSIISITSTGGVAIILFFLVNMKVVAIGGGMTSSSTSLMSQIGSFLLPASSIFLIYIHTQIWIILITQWVSDITSLNRFKGWGYWKETMWVDQVAEKLYVF